MKARCSYSYSQLNKSFIRNKRPTRARTNLLKDRVKTGRQSHLCRCRVHQRRIHARQPSTGSARVCAGQTQARTQPVIQSAQSQSQTVFDPCPGRACCSGDQTAVWLYQDPLSWPEDERGSGEYVGGVDKFILVKGAVDGHLTGEIRPECPQGRRNDR